MTGKRRFLDQDLVIGMCGTDQASEADVILPVSPQHDVVLHTSFMNWFWFAECRIVPGVMSTTAPSPNLAQKIQVEQYAMVKPAGERLFLQNAHPRLRGARD